jgi:hypothetical protein
LSYGCSHVHGITFCEKILSRERRSYTAID